MRARILIFSSATIISALLRSPPLPPKRPRPRHVTCRFPELLQVFIGHANEQFAFSCDIALDSDRRDPTNIRDCRRGWTACHFTKFSTFHPVPGFQRCRHQSAIYLLPLCRSTRPRMSSVDQTQRFRPSYFASTSCLQSGSLMKPVQCLDIPTILSQYSIPTSPVTPRYFFGSKADGSLSTSRHSNTSLSPPSFRSISSTHHLSF